MKNLPKIALGTWSWGAGFAGSDQVFGNHLTTGELKPVFDAAVKYGLNLWDTALVYGMGSSEKVVGEFIKDYPREDLFISTKFTPQFAKESANPVEEMLHQSFENLGTEYVDFYWIHNPVGAPKWVSGLIPLLKSGKVKNVGVSNHNLEQIQQANDILAKEGFKISAVQNHYSLLYRSSEDAGILDYCNRNDITFFAYMVLEQGALSGKYNTQNPLPEGSGRGNTYNKILPQLEELTNAMRTIGERKNASVAQIAVAWAIAKRTLPIIGVTKIDQVEEMVKASVIELSQDEMDTLETLAAKAGVDTKGSWEESMV
ncbi:MULTISPECIES: aldo/keto reductase [unclassified Chryseobacterium]|uniref:aldo/keto reductase n=1 Tax=unclassified Chryseobacterium TaxID=2593645 RepID=UPI000D3A5076|nr:MULTISPECIES: aldo/keto reductase [unclassified Chryseobacterium]PTT74012.1 aldo/keto reductase [Chryseobacterium sp. HMWF001]PVV56902.1 aldo/keto reductase [Chryseobacterium sp. HMWF035]